MPRAGLATEGRPVFVQPLSLTPFDSSPSRGASGETVHFAGTAKASPTRGGGSASALTERLSPAAALTQAACPLSRACARQGRVAAPSVCFGPWCGPRILLAAAPTAPPCFRRWRRSSPLPPEGEPLACRSGFVWTSKAQYLGNGSAPLSRPAAA